MTYIPPEAQGDGFASLKRAIPDYQEEPKEDIPAWKRYVLLAVLIGMAVVIYIASTKLTQLN